MKRICVFAIILLMLSACKQNWQDFSGQNRGAAELRMDTASCQLDSQSAPQTDSSSCTTKGCIWAVTLGNVASQANNFNLCMQSRGWQKVAVNTPSPQVNAKDMICHEVNYEGAVVTRCGPDSEQEQLRNSPQCFQDCLNKVAPTQMSRSYCEETCHEQDNADSEDSSDAADDQDDAEYAFKKGKAAKENGDYSTAINYYLIAANKGNPHAQNNLGVMYEKGLGTPKNRKEALKWYRKAADQGNEVAQEHVKRLSHKSVKKKSPTQS